MKSTTIRQPRFWRVDSEDLSNCDLSVDETVTYNGQPSCLFRNAGKDPNRRAVMLQTMGAVEYRGKRIRFSAKIKTANLSSEVGLFMKVLDSVPDFILADEIYGSGASVTNDWTELAVVIDVPNEARYINFGGVLQSNGSFWIADLQISEVGEDIPLTETRCADSIVDSGPRNFQLVANANSEQVPQEWRFRTNEGENEQFESGLRIEDGRPALWIGSSSKLTPGQGEKSNQRASFSQKFNCSQWRGQRVSFSADIKCKDVGDWCGLIMWIQGINKTLALSTMYDLGLCGNSDWQRWAVVLDVPPTAYSVVVSVTLKGNGEAFFSNLSFETVGSDVPTTDRRTGPKNLTFAETI